jgi:hypothetical protein
MKRELKRKVQDPAQKKKNRKAATALWKPVGFFCFLLCIGAGAAMARENIAPETLKWSSLDPYGVTLFAVPILSAVLIAQSIIGITFANASSAPGQSWLSRVPNLLSELEGSVLHSLVAILSLLAFLVIPLFVLGKGTVKFFQGRYYYDAVAAVGCDPAGHTPCESMGNVWNHFLPKHGLSFADLFNTPYRYEGNLTYIPILFPSLILILSLCALVAIGLYFVHLFARSGRA